MVKPWHSALAHCSPFLRMRLKTLAMATAPCRAIAVAYGWQPIPPAPSLEGKGSESPSDVRGAGRLAPFLSLRLKRWSPFSLVKGFRGISCALRARYSTIPWQVFQAQSLNPPRIGTARRFFERVRAAVRLKSRFEPRRESLRLRLDIRTTPSFV